ncbi:SM-like, degradation of cytoplasmic mRNAs and positively regulates transcription initiation [Globomyces sp. JEL0801]|nr:SM-like, degradation of cytoplasmic mRNAs and positively regulates transcription initiation [Globomyces sp. JEL0801]
MDANLVIQDTVERIFLDDTYSDIYRGVFIVRGENVVLVGELKFNSIHGISLFPLSNLSDNDLEKEQEYIENLKEIPNKEAVAKNQEIIQSNKIQLDQNLKVLKSVGFCTDVIEGDCY